MARPIKILILMSYYQRPKLVRKALNSILKSNEHHQDWELAFGDDGSAIPGRPIVEDVLKDHLDKILFVHTGMTLKDKLEKGLVLGRHCNEVIRKSQADAAIMFCDDDMLHPEYLKKLSDFLEQHQEVLYCYSKISIYNPLFAQTDDAFVSDNKYNQWAYPINPVNKVDASQVAWRLSCCKTHGAWFADSTQFVPGKPWTKDTDKGFFENLSEKCGLCSPTGIYAQYKGVHDYQLLWHKNVDENGLRDYDEAVNKQAGVLF